MDYPCASTVPGSLENSAEDYDFSQGLFSPLFDINDYIHCSDESASETSVHEDGNYLAGSSGGTHDEAANGIFDELGE